MTQPNMKTLNPELLRKIDAYWRAANFLSVGQIYLYDNPLLKQPLKLEHIKPRLLGHWGTTPGLNFIYAHLNHVIKEHDLNVIYITGPGHVHVIRTDEELMIARSVCRVLGHGMASEKRNSDPATEYSSWLDPFSVGGGSHNPR